MKKSLFTVAVLWHPNENEIKDGKESLIVIEPKHILAKDKDSAKIEATRLLCEVKHKSEQLEILVLPF